MANATAPETGHRRSIRLRGYDYSQAGAYFLTICVQDRECLFGEVLDCEMRLNDAGRMVQAVWEELSGHYPGVETDAFVVMPNHLHGIVVLAPTNDSAVRFSGSAGGNAQGLSIGEVVLRYKTMTTRRYVEGVRQHGWPSFRRRVWQRNFFEHVLRGDESLSDVRRYIAENPARWSMDAENPAALRPEPRDWRSA